MSDVVYRPNDSAEPAAPEPVVQLENLDAFRDEQRRRGLELDPKLPEPGMSPSEFADTAGRGTDDYLAREMTKALNKQREQTGQDWEDKAPVIEVRAQAESYRDIRDAVRERTDSRQLAEKDALMAAGVNEHLADAMAARHKERMVRAGVHPTLADEILDPQPHKLGLVDDDGQRLRPLSEHRGVHPSEELTLKDAARFVGNAREQEALQQQAWLQEQQQPQEQELEVIHSEPAPQPQPEQAQQPEQPQVDPYAPERQRLAVETQVAQLSAFERQKYDELARLGLWHNQNLAVIRQVATDPIKYPKQYAQIRQADQRATALIQEIQAAEQSRVIRQNALAQHQRQEAAQRYKAYAAEQDAAFAKHAPEMNTPSQARDLRNDVVALFRNAGFQDSEVDEAWQGRTGVALRDNRVQQIVRKAALYDRMQARAKDIQRRPLPSPQQPGTVPINRAAEADVANEGCRKTA